MDRQGIDLNNLDKSKWKTYRFDEIAQNISERVDPNNTDLTDYIGLEHIDSESLHIKRHGTPDDVNGTKLKFYKGDIIFGRRRAYQRKAGIATSDGFCSAHALVLRANPEIIDPELFPFFLHSDLFMNRAVDISVGSLSPTINWGTLKHQNFLIPPKVQQAKLAKLFWALDEVVDKEKSVLDSIKAQSKVYLNKAFRYGAFLNQKCKFSKYGEIPENWSLKRLDELGDFKNGINKGKDQFGFGRPFVNLLDVFGVKELFNKEFELVNASDSEIVNFNVLKGDVLFIRSSVKPSGVGLTALIREDLIDTVYSGFIIRFRTYDNEITETFKKYSFYEDRFRYSLCRRSTISANININQESLNKLLLPIPPKNEQLEFGRKMSEFEGIEIKIMAKIESSMILQKSLINQVF